MKNNSRINIFIDNDPNWGGTFQYTENIVEALSRKYKKKINIFYTKDVWLKKFRGIDKQKITLNFFKRFFFFMIILLIKDLKKISFLSRYLIGIKENNDIWIFPSQDLLSVIFPGKKIVAVHDLMHLHTSFDESSSLFKRIYRNFRYKKIATNSDKIIFDSEYGKSQFLNHYKVKKSKLYVLPFFVNKMLFKKNNFFKKEKYLLYPAKFWKHKNHINLLKAIYKLVKIDMMNDIKIYLTSSKNLEYKKIENFIKKKGLIKNVKLTGYNSNKTSAKLYTNARALVMPTFFGPTNIPPVEAFNYGCPVLISDIFASREQCGNAALYFNPNEYKWIAEKIKIIWQDELLFAKMRRRSHAMSKKYNFNNYSKKLFKIILN